MPIYTRKGDKGETSLFGGKRVSKANLRVNAYGTVDELDSLIGLAAAEIQDSKLKTQKVKERLRVELQMIQSDLLEIGSMLANPTDIPRHRKAEKEYLSEVVKHVGEFEREIDQMTGKMPELHNFILPGGGRLGALLHLSRTVCRRAERNIVALRNEENVRAEILEYFNRLSDLLFTMARFANYQEGKKETIWKTGG